MKMKKSLVFLVSVIMILALLSGCQSSAPKQDAPKGTDDKAQSEAPKNNDNKVKKIAVCYYNYSDTYISTVRSAFNEMAAKNPSIEVLEFDGGNDQAKQNEQIDTAISKGVDVLLVNIVDTGAAKTVIDKAKSADKPLIFWNREPTDPEVYKNYEKSRFVGTRKEEAGILEGDLIVQYWNEGTHDRNGNGKLDYVLLHGGLDNAEAVARTEFSVKSIKDAGIEVNEIALQICNWDNEKAKQAMDAWLAKSKDDIDVVIANNDGMAIGALNSLQALELNTPTNIDEIKADANAKPKFEMKDYIGVFGVDATEEAKDAIKKGVMAGTVKQDNVAMAEALFKLAENSANDKDFLADTQYKYDESGIAVRIPYQPYVAK